MKHILKALIALAFLALTISASAQRRVPIGSANPNDTNYSAGHLRVGGYLFLGIVADTPVFMPSAKPRMVGAIVFSTTQGHLFTYNGSKWEQAGGGSGSIDTAQVAAMLGDSLGRYFDSTQVKSLIAAQPTDTTGFGIQTRDQAAAILADSLLLKQKKYDLDLVLDFGCVPDGVRLLDAVMTNGSSTLTSASANFTSADVGKYISVQGANNADHVLVTTIASITDAHTITLTASATANTADVMQGGVCYYGSDNTAQLQTWATYVATGTNQSTRTYAPEGIYCIAGAPVQATMNGHWGQIIFPKVNWRNAHTVVLYGPVIGQLGDSDDPNGLAALFSPHAKGAVFMSLNSRVSGAQWVIDNGTDPDAGYDASYFTPVFKNLVVRVLGDYGFLSGIDAQGAANLICDGVHVDHDIAFSHMQSPEGRGNFGILYPANNANTTQRFDNSACAGFEYGIIVSEHVKGIGWYLSGNVYGLGKAIGSHNVDLGPGLLQWNKYHIAYPGGSPGAGPYWMNVSATVEEDDRHPSGWWATVADVYDASNNGAGVIDLCIGRHDGSIYSKPIILGGAGLTVISQKGNSMALGNYDYDSVQQNSIQMDALRLHGMTKTQRDALPAPPQGTVIFQTDNTPGLRVWNGTNWMKYTETAD